jgi:hypothetical protein
MISVVTFVGILMNLSLHPLVQKFLIYVLYAFISPHFVKLFYNILPT